CSMRQYYKHAFFERQKLEIQKRVEIDAGGKYRIVQITIDHKATNFSEWLGTADVELYGKSGSIQRTNLLYRYYGCSAWYLINMIFSEPASTVRNTSSSAPPRD